MQNEEDINMLVLDFLKLKHEISDLQTKQKFIKQQIDVLMKTKQLDTFANDSAYVTYIERNNISVDKKKGFELFGDSFSQILKESQTRFITIKENF